MTQSPHFPAFGAFAAFFLRHEGVGQGFSGASEGVLAPDGVTRPRRAPQCAAFFEIRELAAALRGCVSTGRRPLGPLGRLHAAKGALKHRKATVAARYPQHPAPCVADDARGLVHHLLHHRLDAPTQRRFAQRAVALMQRVLAHDAQQIHGQRRQRAHQVVGGKLARGQAVEIHVGFELGMKLLVRGMVSVQGDDLLRAELAAQRRGPALQHVLGQQHLLALFVEGALAQTVDAPQGALWALALLPLSHLNGVQFFLPQALALTGAQLGPLGGRIGTALLGDALDRRGARVPLDQHIDAPLQRRRMAQCALEQRQRAKARVGTQQQGSLGDGAGQAECALDVVAALEGAVLAARAQIELQAVAARSQVQRDGAVAIDSGVGVRHTFFLGVALIHDEGVDVERQVSALQSTKVYGRTVDVQAQDGAVEPIGQFAPLAAKGIKALAQGGARWHGTQTQGLVRKALGAKAFDGLEVVLAQSEQAQVALEDVAVGDAAAHRVFGIYQGRQVDALEQSPYQGQSALAAELVGQLLDFEVDGIGHVALAHPLGAGLICGRIMYYKRNIAGFEGEVTDSGWWHLEQYILRYPAASLDAGIQIVTSAIGAG